MATSIDYSTVPHETIYQHITGGPGSAALADVSWDCQGVATKLQALQDLVDGAVRGIGVAQQGAAADAATQAMNSPLTHFAQMSFQLAESHLDWV